MIAIFENVNVNILYAARDRAGLIGPVNSEDTNNTLRVLSNGKEVIGSPHAVMRLIGALADDGMDCLVKVL